MKLQIKQSKFMKKQNYKSLNILGIRGIPAAHGGFETFAEHFSLYLLEKGWVVTVYCQLDSDGAIYEDMWNGVNRVNIPVSQKGAFGTIIFDWKSILHAAKSNTKVLTLGYNTAIFSTVLRLKRIYNVMNMDGVEWKRDKWSFMQRVWLYVNEKLGAWLANKLIADHPDIKKHLSKFVSEDKITVIPYSAHIIKNADKSLIEQFGITADNYAIVIARPEPENSIIEIIRAFSRRKRGFNLLVLGNYTVDECDYHKQVINAASDEVIFIGAIYDKAILNSLRYYSRLYIHGHTVGGTNPSLVEALGAGSAVLAHDNRFNRWVAGEGALFFSSESDCAAKLDLVLNDSEKLSSMRNFSKNQMLDKFTWDRVHGEYEKLLDEI